ncbi:hypothetical protein LCGC14_2824900 [marine sediment metagenome]|uniref:Uncharacterized protein n=1 Tax=marine sediment metagenome TaxID=412755 RepID=A0A0F8Z2K9_9ZZZZ
MNSFELLKKRIEASSNNDLARIISDAALQLDEEQTNAVSFVFWLSFMTEHDLDQVLCEAWKAAKQYGPCGEEVVKIIKEKHGIDVAKIDPDDPDYDPMIISFGNRIKIYEDMFGTNSHVKLFRKIKGLRNDISHGRIDKLEYKNLDLRTKEGKQEILIDYFEIMTQKDSGSSLVFQQMSEGEKEEVEKIFKQWKKDIGYENNR